MTLLIVLAASAATAMPRFVDASVEAGIGSEVYTSPTYHSLGINWIDYNNDGWPDIFAVNGIDRPAGLYRNNGDGTFTPAEDLLPPLPNFDMAGSVFADYDNDGDSDIYIYTDNEQFDIEGYNEPDGPPNLLLKNLFVENGFRERALDGAPEGKDWLFEEVAAEAGVDDLAPAPLGSYPGMRAKTAGWFDYDLDGCIDLYVGHMVFQADGTRANRDRLFRNKCDGTFEDKTVAAGIYDTTATEDPSYRPTLAFIAGHFNRDLFPDLYVVHASPGSPVQHLPQGHLDRIFMNNGDGTFTETEFPGVGDDAQAGMGIDFADVDLDGDTELYISDLWEHKYELESPGSNGNPFYLNTGGAFSENKAAFAGIAGASSWGVNFFDVDHDGYEDLFVGTTGEDAGGQSLLYMNNGSASFEDVSASVDMATGFVRGSATADYDQDGDLDLALVNEGGMMQLFRNDTTGHQHWIQIKLVGTTTNRDAIGAVVGIRTNSKRLRREVKGGSSAHSQDSLVLHFGVGNDHFVDAVVSWPGAPTDRALGLETDRIYTWEQGGTPVVVSPDNDELNGDSSSPLP